MKNPMKQRYMALVLSLVLGLAGCGTAQVERADVQVVASTYPIYLLACELTRGVEGVQVERLDTGNVSCLHDYTLSVSDMKKLDRADVLALNGVELEEFMEDALHTVTVGVIDCSENVPLLENLSHHHEEVDEDHHAHDHVHDHGHWDPHIWMDPANLVIMAQNLARGLRESDAVHAGEYAENALRVQQELEEWHAGQLQRVEQARQTGGLALSGLITFHDGFQYFAHAYGLPLLESIEEEAGSEASAREIVDISRLVQQENIPVIFTEENGSEATARAIARETGCRVARLSMVMDGDQTDLADYTGHLEENLTQILAFGAKQEVKQG